MREVPDPHVALLSGHRPPTLYAAKGTLDVWWNVVDIDNASFLIKCKRNLQLATKAKVLWLTMVAASRPPRRRGGLSGEATSPNFTRDIPRLGESYLEAEDPGSSVSLGEQLHWQEAALRSQSRRCTARFGSHLSLLVKRTCGDGSRRPASSPPGCSQRTGSSSAPRLRPPRRQSCLSHPAPWNRQSPVRRRRPRRDWRCG